MTDTVGELTTAPLTAILLHNPADMLGTELRLARYTISAERKATAHAWPKKPDPLSPAPREKVSNSSATNLSRLPRVGTCSDTAFTCYS